MSDEQLPYAEAACNNALNAATRLAPDKTHLGRFLCLLITVIGPRGASSHGSLGRDQLEYCNLAREHEQHAYQVACVSIRSRLMPDRACEPVFERYVRHETLVHCRKLGLGLWWSDECATGMIEGW